MKKNKKILCLILARGGSQRVPGKNIRKLGGKPLLAHAIECALQSRHINRVIVSTDDKKIANVAIRYAAEVPFMRPKNISKGDSKELDAFKHALGWLKEHEGYQPDIIVKLFSTSPFRTTQTVDKAIELFMKNPKADSLRSVRLCSEHPYKMWQIKGKRLNHFVSLRLKPKESHTWSYQILPNVYIQNAAIDVTKPQTIWKKNSITGTKIIPFVMDEYESLDINSPIDFEFAEFLMKKKAKR